MNTAKSTESKNFKNLAKQLLKALKDIQQNGLYDFIETVDTEKVDALICAAEKQLRTA